jgi:hypothetical protein
MIDGDQYVIIVDSANRIWCKTISDVKEVIDKHLVDYDRYFGDKRFSEFFPTHN